MDVSILEVLEGTVEVLAVLQALSSIKSIKPSSSQKKSNIEKKRCRAKPYLLQRNPTSEHELEITDFNDFKKLLSMDQAIFEKLLFLVNARIKKKDTLMRECISAERRLAVTLRFLATGEPFTALSVEFRIASCTISKIVPETCIAIYDVLKEEYMQIPDTPEKSVEISTEFEAVRNFPHCLGALCGKQMKFCHSKTKEIHSVLLLGLVDATFKFRFADVLCDEGYTNSNLKQAIENNTISFPICDEESLPYVFIADDAFPLEEKVMIPYSDTGLTEQERIFNDRLNNARGVAEDAFGILSDRFRTLLTTMRLSFETVKGVIFACLALHNFFIMENNSNYLKRLNYESHDSFQEKCLENIKYPPATRSNFPARNTRDKFCHYFQENR